MIFETQNAKHKTQNLGGRGLLVFGGLVMLGAAAMGQSVHSDFSLTKGSDELRKVFKGASARGNESTVLVREGKEQLAFGTVVGQEGYVLTKASEVIGHRALRVLVGTEDLTAKVVGVSEPMDLAMLKVEGAKGKWKGAEWADLKSDKVEVGEWVATCGPKAMMGQEPVAVGVVSVGRRRIVGRNGFLGVMMKDAKDGTGVGIQQVLSGSAAEKAGVHVGDEVTAVGGKQVRSAAEMKMAVGEYRPGDVVVFSVRRAKSGSAEDLTVTLGANVEDGEEDPSQFSMEKILGGAVSKRSSEFASVFQHDTVIRPMDCGGPIVDLSGKVIGVNIARAGRTETYALPADLVVPMLESLESGRLAPVNANAAATKPKANDE